MDRIARLRVYAGGCDVQSAVCSARVGVEEPMGRPLNELAGLAKAAARRVVGETMPLDARLQRECTFDGEGAIKIVVLFPGARLAELSGDQLLKILGSIWDELSQVGESRLPLVSFVRMEDEPELTGARA